MPVRARLLRRIETIRELQLAAAERYWEGVELLVAGRSAGGRYLLGYVAELLLKCAFFRLTGARLTDPVAGRLVPARRLGRQLIPGVGDENFQSLRFWGSLLIAHRQRIERPLDAALASRLRQRTRRLYGNWQVELRYHPDVSGELERRSVLEDATWIRDHYTRLWS